MNWIFKLFLSFLILCALISGSDAAGWTEFLKVAHIASDKDKTFFIGSLIGIALLLVIKNLSGGNTTNNVKSQAAFGKNIKQKMD